MKKDSKSVRRWQIHSVKDADAVKRETGLPHSGQYQLIHEKDQDYRVYTYQTIKNLNNVIYTLVFLVYSRGRYDLIFGITTNR